ncbi:MAG TPA: hypothetical protein VGR57_10440 [Ktedonobacterales bacterium]|nr:hypothetical protein [Ktedonobacterales bacterium]
MKALATSGDEPRGARLMRRFVASFTALVVLFFLAAFGFAFYELWTAWNSGSWDTFSYMMPTLAIALLLPWRLIGLGADRRRDAVIREGAQAIRRIAARADTQLAPLAEPQPAPLTAEPQPARRGSNSRSRIPS